MALQHWIQLAMTEGVGPILTQRLIQAAGSAQAACGASINLLRTIEGVGSTKSRQIHGSLNQTADEALREIERAHHLGVSIICPDDDLYPTLLRSIPDPPGVLYIKGNLEPRDLNAIAIVGSRRCSFYGREQAERFAALLAGTGLTIISGGARGIDSAAHKGAMSHAQGRTLAVLGCGIDTVYPPENKALFDQIAERGAVLSEYPIGTPPTPENFPRRNRIVSGMSRGVLVIEADERSGALITARQACDDHGRPVFALPGRVDNRMSAGPHKLIRDGAALITCLEDILDGLGPLPQSAAEPTLFEGDQDRSTEVAPPREIDETVGLSEQQRAILVGIDDEPTSVDTIVERTTFPVHLVLQELTFLSLKGAVRRVDGQTFARR
ncbi:MAG TPA: DNA-processing protein DprA [Tepidisphaeraceae bacterium]|nr:DNA-processing protein DprA [Tepidisphaeraceae bacterium]